MYARSARAGELASITSLDISKRPRPPARTSRSTSRLGIVTDVPDADLARRLRTSLHQEPHLLPQRMLPDRDLDVAHGADFLVVDGKVSVSATHSGPRQLTPGLRRLEAEAGQRRFGGERLAPGLHQKLRPEGDAPADSKPAHGADAGALKPVLGQLPGYSGGQETVERRRRIDADLQVLRRDLPESGLVQT